MNDGEKYEQREREMLRLNTSINMINRNQERTGRLCVFYRCHYEEDVGESRRSNGGV